MVLRYFADLAFKGTNYHGWQKQENANSVQSEIESALAKALGEEIEVVGAGRTDTGVHACQMILHFETETSFETEALVFKLNSILPLDISFKSIWVVREDLHARFSATSRTYQYHLSQNKDPFRQELSYYFRHQIDLQKMNQAAEFLKGHHDFSSFSKSNTQTFTNNCEIKYAHWTEKKGGLWIFEIKADRFLRNMVRAIVGTLIEVGQGKREVDSIEGLIAAKDRKRAGYSVPAEGLYLCRIDYPQDSFI